MRIRESECQLRGLSAGIHKIRGKWRIRKYRARIEMRKSSMYNQLSTLAPQLCDEYLIYMAKEFDCLRDSEIKKLIILWKTSSPLFVSLKTDDSVHPQSDHLSEQIDVDLMDSNSLQSIEQSEISNCILNPPFATSPAFELMKSLMSIL